MTKILIPLTVFTDEKTYEAWQFLAPIMFRIAECETQEQRENIASAFLRSIEGVDIDNLVNNYKALEAFKQKVSERFWALFQDAIECYFDDAVRSAVTILSEESELDDVTIRTVLSFDGNDYREIDADISGAL